MFVKLNINCCLIYSPLIYFEFFFDISIWLGRLKNCLRGENLNFLSTLQKFFIYFNRSLAHLILVFFSKNI